MTPGAHGPDDASDRDLRRVFEALVERCDRLEETVDRLTAENAELRAENQDLKDEIARLKGHPPRPKFKTRPSGTEKATSRSKRAKADKARRGSVKEKLAVTSEVKLKVEAPAGSRFKGYEDVFVQDLQIRVAVVRYRRERWETKDGERIIAPLPQGILGGFGPELRRFIAAGHFQGQVTSERLTALLGGMGLQISKRQVVRLLSKGPEHLSYQKTRPSHHEADPKARERFKKLSRPS